MGDRPWGDGPASSSAGEPRFILDVHLGKLAYHLRMLGFDTLYRPSFDDNDLVGISTDDNRILLTRDRELLGRSAPSRSFRVLQTNPRLQLIEVSRRFRLMHWIHPFTRCLLCNTSLQTVDKQAVLHRLPEKVRDLFNEFRFCPRCDKVYWKGSHYERMEEFIRGIMEHW